METPPHTREPSPKKSMHARSSSSNLTISTIENWKRTKELLDGKECIIDGESLDIAAVVAVGK